LTLVSYIFRWPTPHTGWGITLHVIQHCSHELECSLMISEITLKVLRVRTIYRPNFLSGSDFLFPPLLPPLPPPLPLPPLPLPRAPPFLNGTNPTLSLLTSSASSPTTGAMRGIRYLGTCFICGCTLVGCNGLSCRKYSRSSGLSSKWA
jgi:hypothetical protein